MLTQSVKAHRKKTLYSTETLDKVYLHECRLLFLYLFVVHLILLYQKAENFLLYKVNREMLRRTLLG